MNDFSFKEMTTWDYILLYLGVTHIVHMYKGEGEGSSQMHTIAYKGGREFQGCTCMQKNIFWTLKSRNFFCTKEAVTLPFITAYRKV